ncbi:hypothetical protein [Pseudothermotoga thermarum]|uniref:Uncharacterized protein n=1 Tax=Pseudothermotoga thermarum DSM 5069 TaxID=688269 RepID=F7YYD9_9THEM|nr:hypothetical protein [Pseudothermotoga thermarum]AEH50963.1 hypothetical protein Theth_0879 [Pseudothermotoga thermarum DSM 5069]
MARKPVSINRKIAIITALMIFVACAAYFNIYDYFRFVGLLQKVDSQLLVLTELDRNVSEKRGYLSRLESLVQPRISPMEFQDVAKNFGMKMIRNQDGSYRIEGTCNPKDVQQILEVFLANPNLRLKSLSISSSVEVPFQISALTHDLKILLVLEFWSVVDR